MRQAPAFLVAVLVAAVVACTVATASSSEKKIPLIAKASEVIGKNVKSTDGKDLGEIKDLAIDPLDGDIEYAVLSFGGFLGVGDKYFAVPWGALALSQDKKHFVLDVSRRDLAQAPGFDKHNWPDLSDPAYGLVIYEFYEQPSGGEEAPVVAASEHATVRGLVQKIDGDLYLVKEPSGREVNLHVDRGTKMTGSVKPGDRIEAQTTQTTYAQSIKKVP